MIAESAVAALGDDALAVSSMTGDGLDDLPSGWVCSRSEAAAFQPERQPYVVLRPGRPRFTIERDEAGRWRVRGRDVDRWVLEADLDDEREVAQAAGAAAEERGRPPA